VKSIIGNLCNRRSARRGFHTSLSNNTFRSLSGIPTTGNFVSPPGRMQMLERRGDGVGIVHTHRHTQTLFSRPVRSPSPHRDLCDCERLVPGGSKRQQHGALLVIPAHDANDRQRNRSSVKPRWIAPSQRKIRRDFTPPRWPDRKQPPRWLFVFVIERANARCQILQGAALDCELESPTPGRVEQRAMARRKAENRFFGDHFCVS